MLEPALVELLESDAVIVVGTVGPDGLPEATRGWGLRVDAGPPATARLLVPRDAPRLHENLAGGGWLAVTVTDVVTLASAQVKGRIIATEPATAADHAEHDRSFAALAAKIHETDGTDLDVVARFRPGPLGAVVLTVEEVYDQTPGPVAGARLAPSETS